MRAELEQLHVPDEATGVLRQGPGLEPISDRDGDGHVGW
jgi:hypothetical protein